MDRRDFLKGTGTAAGAALLAGGGPRPAAEAGGKKGRLPQLLQISQLGHPVLRGKATPVKDIEAAWLAELIEDMMATMAEAGGVGIAAPQVYSPVRVCIVASRKNDRYPDAPDMAPVAMLNPLIVERSKELVKGWEGCLSVPGLRAQVPRSDWIKVEHLDRKGKKQSAEYSGFVARIVQHELDHLDGLFFIDRLDSNRDIYSEKEYRKLAAKK